MKKVYIPTKDELSQLQDLSKNSKNIYQYLLVKVVEVLVIEGILDQKKGMLQVAYDYFKDIPEIAYAICRMYPREIDKVPGAENEILLCYSLIEGLQKKDDTIKGLDEILPRFESGIGVLSNRNIIDITSKCLAEKLPSYPNYRFEYKPNSLLDDIFSCEIETFSIPLSATTNFMVIDPIYITKLEEYQFRNTNPEMETERSLYRYINRYGINLDAGTEYYSRDILTNPDQKVKKLMRCLEHHKQNYQ